jgi:hypothetical protein
LTTPDVGPDGPCAPGRCALRLPAGLQSGIPARPDFRTPDFSEKKMCAGVLTGGHAGTRAESGTALRCTVWCSRCPGWDGGSRRTRELVRRVVGGTTVAVGSSRMLRCALHARTDAGLDGRRGGARAAYPRAAARGPGGEARPSHRATVPAAAGRRPRCPPRRGPRHGSPPRREPGRQRCRREPGAQDVANGKGGTARTRSESDPERRWPGPRGRGPGDGWGRAPPTGTTAATGTDTARSRSARPDAPHPAPLRLQSAGRRP